MRKNLDPFNEHTDEELWNALEEVTSAMQFSLIVSICVRAYVQSIPGELCGGAYCLKYLYLTIWGVLVIWTGVKYMYLLLHFNFPKPGSATTVSYLPFADLKFS